MNKFLTLLLSFQVLFAVAQPGVAPVVDRDGGKYYAHKVEAGNTLWGIQSMYDVGIDELMVANPELKDGLKAGQTVYIPVKEDAVEEPISQLVSYKVKKGETLYGLSKKFDTSVDELIANNPELKDGLKKGQVILVPASDSEVIEDIIEEEVVEEVSTPNPFVTDTIDTDEGQVTVTFDDDIVEHTVKQGETMYSISKRFMVPIKKLMEFNDLKSTTVQPGQVLRIPLKKERIQPVEIKNIGKPYNPDGEGPIEFEKKGTYKIAVLAPFFLDYGTGYSKYVSNLATQFYMGSKLALDSLQMKGLNAEVFYLDTKNDSATVQELLNDLRVNGVDLIIGPFYKNNQKVVAQFCKENKVRMITPASVDEDLLENNRLLYSTVPDDKILMEGLAEYFVATGEKRIVLVKPTSEKDLKLYNAFKDRFYSIEAAVKPKLIETSVDGVKSYLTRDAINVFVVPSNDKKFAMKFMETVNMSAFRSRPDQITVYGTKDWLDFSEMNNAYKNKYNFHYPTYNFEDYYTDEMMALNKWYRSVYNTDLPKMAAQAYDVMTYFCSAFFMDDNNPTLMINDFEMEQVESNSGYTNRNVIVVKQDEFVLTKVYND